MDVDRRCEIIIASVALATRLGHWLGFLLGRLSDLYYLPVLASSRFETGAMEILRGSPQNTPFMFAGSIYTYIIVPVYALGAGRMPVLVLQTLFGIVIPLLVFRLSRRLGAAPVIALACSTVWCLYGPALFLELAILPETLAALTTLVLVLMACSPNPGPPQALSGGLMGGFLAGVRAPLAAAALPLLLRVVLDRRRSAGNRLLLALGIAAAFSLPLIPLAVHQSRSGAGFYPFPRVGGLNLALGHSDGVTGYGPPAASLGLVENPGEDISAVSLRIARENGADGPPAADAYWRSVAFRWIRENPGPELSLMLSKLGGFFGFRAIEVYHDMGRLNRFNTVFRFMPVPRWLLVLPFCIALVPFVRNGRHRTAALLPVAASLLTSLVFFHTERFSLPVEPLMLAIAASGLTAVAEAWRRGARGSATAGALAGLVLAVPAIIRPVPEIPEGIYLESMAARAYNLNDFELALELYERAAVIAPEGTVTWFESHRMAALIASSLGMREKAELHEEALLGVSRGSSP